ncbi:hypothetical protein Anas_07815 [Armadillidium nasatum]|uniref:C-type lectin domain-containing protein n=1 Tax=Armadillidium nasatum TaxID=96803 RepID=A0A5N5SNV0_9CRUS|nr:hypothetical protein Anas_07815 [Armadillidium nasatum]
MGGLLITVLIILCCLTENNTECPSAFVDMGQDCLHFSTTALSWIDATKITYKSKYWIGMAPVEDKWIWMSSGSIVKSSAFNRAENKPEEGFCMMYYIDAAEFARNDCSLNALYICRSKKLNCINDI